MIEKILEDINRVNEQEGEGKKFQIIMTISTSPDLDVDWHTIDGYVKGLVEEGEGLLVEDIHVKELFGE